MNMSLLAFSNYKQQRKQKVYGVPSAFSCFSSKKILSSIGKKDAIKKNDKYFEKIKNVVKTTDFFFYFRYTKNRCKKLLYSEKEIL